MQTEQMIQKGVRIAPESFQHPADKAACDAIRSSDEFKKALGLISEKSLEKYLEGIYSASLLQITPKMSPELYKMLDNAMKLFDEERLPVIYTTRSYEAMTNIEGVKKKYVTVTTGLLSKLNEKKAQMWAAQCICAIKCGYGEIGFIDLLCQNIGGLILPDIVVNALSMLMANWRKYSLLTLDRAALIASGDINETIRNIYIGFPEALLEGDDLASPDSMLYKQAKELAKTKNAVTAAARNIYAATRKNAFRSLRYFELLDFYRTDYRDLLEELE